MKGELENKAGGLKTAVTNAINPTSGNFLGMNVTSHVLENTDDFLRQTLLRKALKNGANCDEADVACANEIAKDKIENNEVWYCNA